jgi:MFS family permease
VFSVVLAEAPRKSNNGWDMVCYRVFQGIGASLMFANSTAIITDLYAGPKLGIAVAINQMALACGIVLGPVVGGGLTSVSWRWVYLINVPLGGVAFIIGALFVKDKPQVQESKPTGKDVEMQNKTAAPAHQEHPEPEPPKTLAKWVWFKLTHRFDFVGAFMLISSMTFLLTVIGEGRMALLNPANVY